MRAPAALAVTAGLLALARRSPPDTWNAPWPVLSPEPATVTTDDGLALAAFVHGSGAAGPVGTVVFSHGYTLASGLWDRQVAAVLAARPDLRVVTYDQRGHGLSARGPRDSATIEQLGHDLFAVLDQLVPDGPIVLVGHSMGGMTIMSLVELHPELVGPRVVAVELVATSSGNLASSTWGLPESVAARVRELIPLATAQAGRREDAGKRPMPQSFLRPMLFGRHPRADDLRRTFAVMGACSAHTVDDFFETFTTHDRVKALAALSGVPVTICIGTQDRLCPLPHSQAMAAALPHASLHVYPGAGHMLLLERADEVSAQLVRLCSASSAAPV